MNVELLKKVRDAIEMEPDMYTQDSWGLASYLYNDFSPMLTCNTPGCIAGHVIVHGDPTRAMGIMDGDTHISDIARELLGISSQQRDYLFDAKWPVAWARYAEGPVPLYGYQQHRPSTSEAVQLLNRLIEYGFEE